MFGMSESQRREQQILQRLDEVHALTLAVATIISSLPETASLNPKYVEDQIDRALGQPRNTPLAMSAKKLANEILQMALKGSDIPRIHPAHNAKPAD